MAKNETVKQFQSGDISAEHALQVLGKAIAEAKVARKSTRALEAAVSEILGIGEEPEAEDYAGATAWESSRHGSAE
jgi:hypothetical protein